MPTLLAVNNYYYSRGGAETVFLEQAKIFGSRGWNVVPFCMKHPRNIETPWSKYFVDEIEFGSEYSLREKLIRVPKVIYSLEARQKLGKLLDTIRPDICHAHNIYNHISPSILGLLHSRDIPTVVTLHDLKMACPAYNMLAPDGICERCKGGRIHNVVLHRCIKDSVPLSIVMMMEALLHRLLGTYVRHVDRLIVPSKFYIKKFIDWGIPESKFAYVPNFVAVDQAKPKFTAGEAFLYFGRLSPEKGLITLVRSAAALNCKLWIAGTGPQLDELRALSSQLNANVSFLGHLAGDVLKNRIRDARAVVLPSEWYENAPMSVLEAYAHGKPVIGARIGGIPELIKEGETGFGFDSGSVDSLSDALVRFIELSDTDIEQMGRSGRAWVENVFTAEQHWQRLCTVYRALGVAIPETLSVQNTVPN